MPALQSLWYARCTACAPTQAPLPVGQSPSVRAAVFRTTGPTLCPGVFDLHIPSRRHGHRGALVVRVSDRPVFAAWTRPRPPPRQSESATAPVGLAWHWAAARNGLDSSGRGSIGARLRLETRAGPRRLRSESAICARTAEAPAGLPGPIPAGEVLAAGQRPTRSARPRRGTPPRTSAPSAAQALTLRGGGPALSVESSGPSRAVEREEAAGATWSLADSEGVRVLSRAEFQVAGQRLGLSVAEPSREEVVSAGGAPPALSARASALFRAAPRGARAVRGRGGVGRRADGLARTSERRARAAPRPPGRRHRAARARSGPGRGRVGDPDRQLGRPERCACRRSLPRLLRRRTPSG